MTVSTISAVAVPTGGVISLAISGVGALMTLSRSSTGSGGSFTQLYSGAPLIRYIDVGDMLPAPLASGSVYTYRLNDANGSLYSADIQPAATLQILQEPLLQMLIRIIQAGINNLYPTAGFNSNFTPAQVIAAMPLSGLPPMPFVTINLDLMQQAQIPIGQSVEVVEPDGSWVIGGMTKRVFRVSVLAGTVQERDFYRDAVLGIFQSIIRTVFAPIGLDVTHKYQVASGQVAKDTEGQSPGFYYADVMMDFEGIYNVAVVPNYGSMAVIQLTAQLGNNTSLTVTAS